MNKCAIILFRYVHEQLQRACLQSSHPFTYDMEWCRELVGDRARLKLSLEDAIMVSFWLYFILKSNLMPINSTLLSVALRLY